VRGEKKNKKQKTKKEKTRSKGKAKNKKAKNKIKGKTKNKKQKIEESSEKGRDTMGAPKGNTNALKHGLYAKRFSPEEITGLRKMSPRDMRHEFYMMRVAVKNLFEVQKRIMARLDSLPGSSNPADELALAKITNSLAVAIAALNTTARTMALFEGTDTTLNDPLDEALSSLPIFLDDTYLEEREVEDGEVLVEKGE
jgi:uncharacterized protein YjcR